ncbi:MAG: guanylate kinase [Patescibacteria group bacterium]
MATRPITEEIAEQKKRGVLIILTGPTAAGKDTVMKKLLEKRPTLIRMVTTNSRPMREGEVEGTDYHFVSREDFEKLIADDAFVEWVEYLGHYKGGQKKHLEEALASGKDVVWRIDVRGVKNIRSRVEEMVEDPDSPVQAAVFIFLAPPELETLEKRMRTRGAENEKVWIEGLNLAKWELAQYDDCDYLVLNEDGKLDDAVTAVEAIIEATRRIILAS